MATPKSSKQNYLKTRVSFSAVVYNDVDCMFCHKITPQSSYERLKYLQNQVRLNFTDEQIQAKLISSIDEVDFAEQLIGLFEYQCVQKNLFLKMSILSVVGCCLSG